MLPCIPRFTGFGRACAIIALLVSVSACSFRPNDDKTVEANKKRPVIVIPVEAEYPERGSISDYLDTNGRVEAEQGTAILTQGAGPCMEVFAEEGDYVEQDQALAQLKTDDAKAALNNIQQQVLQNKSTYSRIKKLHDDGLSSDEDRDNARHSYEGSKAQLEQQQLQLDNLTIRAPFAGVITLRDIKAGMIVPAAHIAFNIIDPTTFMLAIYVDEKYRGALREGQMADVTVDAAGDEIFSATVRRINPGIDGATGNVKVILDFEEGAHARLFESAFARIKLVMETHGDALLLSKDAIIEENSRTYVYVLRPDASTDDEIETSAEPDSEAVESDPVEERHSVERLEVTTGLEDALYVEILSGIEESDVVVTNGHFNLKPEATVKVTNMEAELMSLADLTPVEALAKAEAEAERKKKESQQSR
jgi:RND family efflux transporter MFP subunit